MMHKSLRSVVNSVAFMCFSLGFNMGIIAGAILYLELAFIELKDNKVLSGVVAAAVLLSAFLSNMVVGPLADRVGRVLMLHLTNIPFVIGAAIVAVAGNPSMIIFGRSITGIAVGFAGSLPNLYIAEIAPPDSRGKLVGLAPMFITIGIMSSQLFAVAVAEVLGEARCVDFGWRIMFASGAIPAVFQGFWSLGIPESPRWCYQKLYMERAERHNKIIASLEGGVAIEAPVLGSSVRLSGSGVARTARERGGGLSFKFAVIAGGLSAMQQLSGINAVVFYAPQIFRALGIVNKLAILNSSCISILQILVVFGSTRLVDSWGRRTLCKIGIMGMTCGHLMLAFTFSFKLPVFLAIAGILVFRLLFSLSLGPLPYIMVTELFPQHQRAKGVAASMMVNWLLNWVVVFSVPELMHRYDGDVFFGFAAVCLVSFFIVHAFLPETAGTRLGELPSKESEAILGASFDTGVCASYGTIDRRISDLSTEYFDRNITLASSDVLMASRQSTN
mmetsp:Transcript_37668/g.70436  ORF Transcript_37668/g.70436 Transcript_37668/m.70436 type:complete len:503 (+) Transcript_37668:36-1544(+)